MKKLIKKILVITICSTIFSGFIPNFLKLNTYALSSYMSQIKKKRNELKKYQSKQEEIQLHLRENLTAQENINQRIVSINQEITTIKDQIIEISNQQKKNSIILQHQNRQVKKLKEYIETNRKKITQRASSLYLLLAIRNKGYSLEIPNNETLKNNKIFELFLSYDMKILDEYQKRRRNLRQIIKPYSERESMQQILFKQKQKLKKELEERQQKHQQLLLKLKEDRQVYYHYLAELQNSIEKITAEMDYLIKQNRLYNEFKHAKGLSTLKGNLPFPVEGKIIQSFGPFKNRKRTSNSIYQGIIFETKDKALISSVARGKVVFAQFLDGYHQLVILDHGKDSFSVYGNLEGLIVKKNDFLDAGDPIGYVKKNSSGKYHTYFEIRIKRRSVNPSSWFVTR